MYIIYAQKNLKVMLKSAKPPVVNGNATNRQPCDHYLRVAFATACSTLRRPLLDELARCLRNAVLLVRRGIGLQGQPPQERRSLMNTTPMVIMVLFGF